MHHDAMKGSETCQRTHSQDLNSSDPLLLLLPPTGSLECKLA